MTKTEINAAIVAEARAKIKDLGLQPGVSHVIIGRPVAINQWH